MKSKGISKLANQCERSTGSSTCLEKKPRALIEPGKRNKATTEATDKTMIDNKSKVVMIYGESYAQPKLSSGLRIFNLKYRHNSNEENKIVKLYLNLLLKPNNFFLRETVKSFVLDALNEGPMIVLEPPWIRAPKFLT